MANNGTKTISKLLIKERQTQLINKKIIYSLRKIKKKKKKTINTIKNNFKLSKSIQINYILELS